MHRIVVIILLLNLILFDSCKKGESNESTTINQSNKVLIDDSLLRHGTVDFQLEKKLISSDEVSIRSHSISQIPILEEPQLGSRTYHLLKTIRLNTSPKLISYNQGKFPKIKKIDIGQPKIIYKLPEIRVALPYQNESHEKLNIKTLGIAQGLKSAFTTAVYEDSRGYFWFGSRRGLTRYDSYSFHYYPFAEDNQHREIGAITEDLDGNIWMTFGAFGGLVKFDGQHFYEYNEGSGLNLGEQYLGIIHADKKGNIWLKSESNIIKFDGKTFTCFPYQFQNLKYLNVIIKENEKGHFWLSALGGVCSLIDDEVRYYAIEEENENNLCHPILEDERGLIMTTGTGIAVLKGNALQFFPIDFIKENDIRNTLQLGDDFILASEQKKNAICSLKDSIITVIHENAPFFTNAQPLFVDQHENIWLSTPGKGVQTYNPKGFKHFKFEELKKGGNISAILEDDRGNIWFGSHGFGLYKYDGVKHHYYELIEGRKELTIRTLFQDHEGNIWAGSVYFGFYKIENIHSETPVVTRYNCFKNEDFSVFSIAEDVNHTIWIGTQSRGLLSYDGHQFARYLPNNSDTTKDVGIIRALLPDSKGNLWIGLENGGLKKHDGRQFYSYTTAHGLSSNHVVSLMEAEDGAIWVGTSDNGVNRFNGNAFEAVTMKDGLTSNAIWTITEDEQGNIWLGASNCLNILLNKPDSLKNYQIKTYCNLDGLIGAEFYANSGIIDRKNQLWWGSDQMAVMAPKPENLLKKGNLKVNLESINIVNTEIDFKLLKDSMDANKNSLQNGEHNLDVASIEFEAVLPFTNCPTDLKLPPKINDLEFIFSVRGTNSLEDIMFSYFMEGIDKDWSIPTKLNTIDYRGLPSGTYTLRTKVSEIKGVWSTEYNYTFTILPFWWETWWAYGLWISLSLLSLWGINLLLNIRRKEKEDAKHLKEMDMLKSELYANITHEFRTPLTLIMGMNEQINSHEKEKSIIRRNSQKLLLQVNQLLDTAKLESGELKLSIVQTDIINYIHYLAESFYSLAEDKAIKLTVYTELNALIMDFDEAKIQGIIYNLLSNAIKFTSEGGAVILHVSKMDRDGQTQLRIKVKDNGIGIDPEQLDRIFDRFYQAKTNQKNTSAGTGIGLSLTKSFIEMMAGKISVISSLENGTEFTLLLPITNKGPKLEHVDFARPKPLTEEKTHLQVESDLDNSKDPNALHLLIIEDNKDISNYLSDIFRTKYVVHACNNGKLGLEKAIDIIPDAIISDIAMPEMDGFEVCEFLKKDERTSHIPIILLTAKTMHEDKLKGLRYGADAYLTKPFSREELEINVQKLIDVRKEMQKYYLRISANTTPSSQTKELEEIQDHGEELFLNKISTIIEKHLDDSDFGVPELADKMKISQMQVYRKLKALTDKTPSQFIRSFRLNKGLDLLKNTNLTISEIAYEVGFSDPNYFSRTFHKEFGNPPGAFRN